MFCFTVLSLWAQGIIPEPKEDTGKHLWGFINPANGKWVVKPNYQKVESYSLGDNGEYRALVHKGNLQGYVGVNGKPLGAGVVFESIEPMSAGNNSIVKVKGKYGVANKNGVLLIKPNFTAIKPIGNDYYMTEAKGKNGVINTEGSFIVPAEYDNIDLSEEDYFLVEKGKKAGILSRNGTMVLEPSKYNKITHIDGWWQVHKGDKMGLIEIPSGKLIVEPKYNKVGTPIYASGEYYYPISKKNGLWGLVNGNGRDVLKRKHWEIGYFQALDAILLNRPKVGYRVWFPKNGTILEARKIKDEYHAPFTQSHFLIEKPNEGISAERAGGLGLWEQMDYPYDYAARKKQFESLSDTVYINTTDSKGKSIKCEEIYKLGGNCLVIPDTLSNWEVYSNKGDKILTVPITGSMEWFSEKEEWYSNDTLALFPDMSVKEIAIMGEKLSFVRDSKDSPWMPMLDDRIVESHGSYNDVDYGPENIAFVKKNGLWGVFTENGLAIDCKLPYELGCSDFDNFYEVYNGDKVGLMASDGEMVLEPKYDSIEESVKPEWCDVYENDKVGIFVPQKKKWIVNISDRYDNYEMIKTNLDTKTLFVNWGEKYGVIDENGKIIVPVEYKNIEYLEPVKYFAASNPGKNSRKYFNADGRIVSPTPKATLSLRTCQHVTWPATGQWHYYDLKTEFLKDHKIKVICQVYNDYGQPLKKGREEWDFKASSDFYTSWTDPFFPPRLTYSGYYVKHTVLDVTTGKTLATLRIDF